MLSDILSFGTFVFWAYYVINIFFCMWLAGQKGRAMGGWSLWAILFGFLASFFLMAAASLLESSNTYSKELTDYIAQHEANKTGT
jgi:hypothetical protein